MRETNSWSLSLGYWGGIQIRVHALFLVAAWLMLYFAAREPGILYGLLGVGLWFLSVLIHELGHAVAAWRLGGSVDQIVIGPLGGMQPVNPVQEPNRDLLIALSGPVANMVVWICTVPALYVLDCDLFSLLKNPFHPQGLADGGDGLIALKLVCWINWHLFLVNLLPTFPLDGGRVMRDILWPAFELRHASLAIARFGWVIALILIGVIALIEDVPGVICPPWFLLGLLAMFIFFQSRREIERIEDHEVDDEMFGYDFSQGYTSLERPHDPPRPRLSPLRRWLKQRRAEKERRQRELEADEERRVDEILIRLHGQSLETLSADERALLNRVSARYRNRQQS